MSDVLITAPSSVSAPPMTQVATAIGGLALLGCAAALGTRYVDVAVRTAPSAIVIALGAAVLTSPALLVAHQLTAMRSPPEAIVGAIGRGVVRLGALAAGFAPFVLFFAITSGLASWVFGLSLVAAAMLASMSTVQQLVRLEARHADLPVGGPIMAALGAVWVGLTGLVAIRLAVSLFHTVL